MLTVGSGLRNDTIVCIPRDTEMHLGARLYDILGLLLEFSCNLRQCVLGCLIDVSPVIRIMRIINKTPNTPQGSSFQMGWPCRSLPHAVTLSDGGAGAPSPALAGKAGGQAQGLPYARPLLCLFKATIRDRCGDLGASKVPVRRQPVLLPTLPELSGVTQQSLGASEHVEPDPASSPRRTPAPREGGSLPLCV